MRRNLTLIGGIAALALAFNTPALSATTPLVNENQVQILAVDIGKAAHQAEARTKGLDSVAAEKEIATSVQELVVKAGQPPVVVRDALLRIINLCIRPAEKEISGITCPGNANSFSAIKGVLGIVVSLLDDGTAAGNDSSGPTPTSVTLPISGGGGADYRQHH
jgi:hypothetical protein